MFNLEQAIAEWRQRLKAQGITPAEVLDELESHLRDDIERQTSSGTDVGQAFEKTVKALGNPKSLQEEFAKVAMPNDRRRDRFVRTICYLTAAVILVINTWTILAFLTGLERLAGGLALTATVLYLAVLPSLERRFSSVAYERFTRILKLAANMALLFPLWLLLSITGVISAETGLLNTMLLWLAFSAVSISAIVVTCNGNQGRGGLANSSAMPRRGASSPISQHPAPPETDPSQNNARSLPSPDKSLLEIAREEASRWGHEYIGTEHVLLAVLRQLQNTTTDILCRLQINCESVQEEMERFISPSAACPAANATLPLTLRARKALRLAAREARHLRHSHTTAAHVLLGLMLEGDGLAAHVLKNMGIRIEQIRAVTRL